MGGAALPSYYSMGILGLMRPGIALLHFWQKIIMLSVLTLEALVSHQSLKIHPIMQAPASAPRPGIALPYATSGLSPVRRDRP